MNTDPGTEGFNRRGTETGRRANSLGSIQPSVVSVLSCKNRSRSEVVSSVFICVHLWSKTPTDRIRGLAFAHSTDSDVRAEAVEQVVAAFAGPVDLVNPLIPHYREDQGVERWLEAENGSKRGRVDADDEGAEPDVAQHRREDRRNLRQALRKKFVTERIHGARYARAMAE